MSDRRWNGEPFLEHAHDAPYLLVIDKEDGWMILGPQGGKLKASQRREAWEKWLEFAIEVRL